MHYLRSGFGDRQCLKALEVGLSKFIVVDVSDRRLDMAKRLDADEVINVAVEDPLEKAMGLVGSAPLSLDADSVYPGS